MPDGVFQPLDHGLDFLHELLVQDVRNSIDRSIYQSRELAEAEKAAMSSLISRKVIKESRLKMILSIQSCD